MVIIPSQGLKGACLGRDKVLILKLKVSSTVEIKGLSIDPQIKSVYYSRNRGIKY